MGKLTLLEHLKACAEAARAFTDGRIGTIAGTVSECLEEIDEVKADKASFSTATLTASGWATNTDTESKNAGYGYSYKLTAKEATASDSAECILSTGSLAAAGECGLCQTVTVSDGSICFYAADKPTSSLSIQWRLLSGATKGG
jgi:hypothetical protein